MDSEEWFTLAELATRLGSLVWVEENLAELLTRWSVCESHAPTAVLFATTSRHHQWHASVVRECLPTSPQLVEDDVVRAPTNGWSAAVITLNELVDPDATAARLKAIVKVIDPWLARETASLLDVARPVSDAAMMRWLRFVSIDHDDDGQAAKELLAARSADAVRFDDHIVVSELNLG